MSDALRDETACGRRLVKKAAIFGFARLLIRPCRYADGRRKPPPLPCE
jgi:hypothetical protein